MLKFDNDIHKKRIIRRPLRGTELVMEQTVSAVYFSYLQDWIDAAAHCSLRYWVLSTYLHCFNFMTSSLPKPQMKILLFLLIQLIFLYQSLMIFFWSEISNFQIRSANNDWASGSHSSDEMYEAQCSSCVEGGRTSHSSQNVSFNSD